MVEHREQRGDKDDRRQHAEREDEARRALGIDELLAEDEPRPLQSTVEHPLDRVACTLQAPRFAIGTRRTSRAKAHCKRSPQNSTRREIALRLSDKA